MEFKVSVTEDMDIRDIQDAIQKACDEAKAEAAKAYEAKRVAAAREKQRKEKEIKEWRAIVVEDMLNYCIALGIMSEDSKDEMREITEEAIETLEAELRASKAMVDMLFGGKGILSRDFSREDVKCGGADEEDIPKAKEAKRMNDDEALKKFLKSLI